jgi:hypothetical protein
MNLLAGHYRFSRQQKWFLLWSLFSHSISLVSFMFWEWPLLSIFVILSCLVLFGFPLNYIFRLGARTPNIDAILTINKKHGFLIPKLSILTIFSAWNCTVSFTYDLALLNILGCKQTQSCVWNSWFFYLQFEHLWIRIFIILLKNILLFSL